jgi:hypothetical protein
MYVELMKGIQLNKSGNTNINSKIITSHFIPIDHLKTTCTKMATDMKKILIINHHRVICSPKPTTVQYGSNNLLLVVYVSINTLTMSLVKATACSNMMAMAVYRMSLSKKYLYILWRIIMKIIKATGVDTSTVSGNRTPDNALWISPIFSHPLIFFLPHH